MKKLTIILMTAFLVMPLVATAAVKYEVYFEAPTIFKTTVHFNYTTDSLLTLTTPDIAAINLENISIFDPSYTLLSARFIDPMSSVPAANRVSVKLDDDGDGVADWQYTILFDVPFAAIGYYPHFSSFVDITEVSPVPEPSTMLLLGSGLVGLVGYGRRRFKK